MYVTILDSLTGKPTPARIRITKQEHVVNILPSGAIAVMYGLWDHADGFGFLPDSAFYSDGGFELMLPTGEYKFSFSKGLEYVDQQYVFNVEANNPLVKTIKMHRWINMPQRGWYSADGHIHIRRSPREDPMLLQWMMAEGINVGVLLRMGDYHATYYEQYGFGERGIYQSGDHMLTAGQEDPRTPELGHALGIAATKKVRFRDEYYFYDKVYDKLREYGGVTGYAHQAKSFHGYRGLMLDGLRHKVDALELLQFCVSEDPLLTDHYYHMLDLGYAITAIAGSDFPWCGHDHDGPPERNARIGNVRFYTYTGSSLTFHRWREGLKTGHTFVTNGPILEFTVNGRMPGDSLEVTKGNELTITAIAYGHPSQAPLHNLEIVKHGKVIARAHVSDKGQSASQLNLSMKVTADDGFWIAARSNTGMTQAAHTTPVYVSVDGNGFHNGSTMQHYLQLSEQYLQELTEDLRKISDDPEKQGWRYRKGLELRITEARTYIELLKEKLVTK